MSDQITNMKEQFIKYSPDTSVSLKSVGIYILHKKGQNVQMHEWSLHSDMSDVFWAATPRLVFFMYHAHWMIWELNKLLMSALCILNAQSEDSDKCISFPHTCLSGCDPPFYSHPFVWEGITLPIALCKVISAVTTGAPNQWESGDVERTHRREEEFEWHISGLNRNEKPKRNKDYLITTVSATRTLEVSR